jgi:hypothetical protein
MTARIVGVSPEELVAVVRSPDLDAVADELVAAARAGGVALTGPGGLLTGLTKRVLESALEVEMADHLGQEHSTRMEK